MAEEIKQPEWSKALPLEVGQYCLMPHKVTRWERFKMLFGYIPRPHDVYRVVSEATTDGQA